MRILHTIHHPVSACNFVAPLLHHGTRPKEWSFTLAIDSGHCPHASIAKISRHNLVTDVAFDLTLNPFLNIIRLLRFYFWLRKNHFDAVHCHQSRGSLIPLLAAVLARIKIRIYHNHGLPFLGHSGATRVFLFLLDQINTRLSTKVLFVSRCNQQAAQDHSLCPLTKGALPGNGSACGIDASEWPSAENLQREKEFARLRCEPLRDKNLIVLFVGRPTRRKGFFDAIEAWRISQCGETGASLLLAGISEREFSDSVPNPPLGVTPLGFVAKLDSFYLAADVVFLPSHHEGFPYSLLEGAVAGCLCLASDINGIRSATPPNAGVLCLQSDIEAFARALRHLQKHRSTIIDSGLLAHQWATKNFERSATCSAIHDTVRRHIVSTSISATTPHVQ